MNQPNFLIVIADQLRADAVGAFGGQHASTPNLDRLADGGVRFTNAFVQHTVCSPSRVSFLTGSYPHVRGHRSLFHLLQPDDPNLLKSLKQGGYHVTHVGERGDTFAPGATELSCTEYGWIDPPTTGAFDQLRRADPDDPMSRAFYVGHIDDAEPHDFDEAAVSAAETWLGQRPSDQPWALYVPLFFPHCPFAVNEPWFSMHDRGGLPDRRPPVASGHEPDFMEHLRTMYGTERLTEEQWREIAGTYHGMVSRLDWHVGRIVDALGDDRNTVIVFLSDHGEYLGDYGLIEKWPSGMHDCLTRDPLIMAGAGLPKGTVVDSMVELVDIVPTVLDLAGIEPDFTHFGRSLLQVIEDPRRAHREHAFTEGGFTLDEAKLLERAPFPYDLKVAAEHERPETVGKATAVRTREWTYVRRLYELPELYDRRNDPDELRNLAEEPEFRAVRDELDDVLLQWMMGTSDVFPWHEDPRAPGVDLPRPLGAAPGSSVRRERSD